MNYTQLVQEVKDYIENDFTDSDMETFVRSAEQRIYNNAQLPASRATDTTALVSGDSTYTTPSGWLSTHSFAVVLGTGEVVYLLNKDQNFIRAAYPTPTSGVPAYYAVADENTFILGPTPNGNYATEHVYYRYPVSIVDAGTSWLGDNFETVLLYGTLLEAATFTKSEEDVMKNYQARYTEAMAQFKQLIDGKERRDSYRSGQFRMDVV